MDILRLYGCIWTLQCLLEHLLTGLAIQHNVGTGKSSMLQLGPVDSQ